jgi:hypothetical protein
MCIRWGTENGEGSEEEGEGAVTRMDVAGEGASDTEARGQGIEMEVEAEVGEGKAWGGSGGVCHVCRAQGVERPDPACAECTAIAGAGGRAGGGRRGILKVHDNRERQRGGGGGGGEGMSGGEGSLQDEGCEGHGVSVVEGGEAVGESELGGVGRRESEVAAGGRRKFTAEEDENILAFLLEREKERQTKPEQALVVGVESRSTNPGLSPAGEKLWRMAESAQICPGRSWMSLKVKI